MSFCNRHRRDRAKREARARKKIRELLVGANYARVCFGGRENAKKKKNVSKIKERADRLSRCRFPSPIHSELRRRRADVSSSSSVRVPFLSLSLSLSRARAKKEVQDQTNEGKRAHARARAQGAREGKTESEKASFIVIHV